MTFDRSRDTIVLEWPASPGAKSYYVRVESPFGPHAFFTDSTRVRLPGDLRNTDLDRLPHVFIPGFPQAVTVSAVDSNYYDWYRSHNDVLSGIGLVNRVQGGLGVFGSLVRLRYQNLSVVTQQTEAIAGHYVFVGTNEERLGIPFLSLEVYTESRAAHAGQQDDLSGRYEKRLILGETDPIRGLLGKVGGGRIQLAFLSLWSAYDTLDVLTGEVHGDTIVGTFRSHAGTGHFVKN